MSKAHWRSEVEDQAMQDEHRFAWEAILDTIDVDLAGKRVLDVGCNQGGFLRLIADEGRITEGFGYDPAPGAVAAARRSAARRRLQFEVADTVPTGWSAFDVAFSHEVLYLLHDLAAHASAVFQALSPGGVYFAVMGVHAGSPLMAAWHAANKEELHLPGPYDLDDVVGVFRGAGFDAAASRLAIRFVPVAGRHHREGRLLDWLDYYSEHKILLRFSRPREPAATP